MMLLGFSSSSGGRAASAAATLRLYQKYGAAGEMAQRINSRILSKFFVSR